MSMNFKYLLDTNVIVAHFRNTYDLTEKLKTTECCISAVVLGELIY